MNLESRARPWASGGSTPLRNEEISRMTFPCLGWNTGGVALCNFAQSASDWLGGLSRDAIVCVQEVARGRPGWQRLSFDEWTAVLHRQPESWRGTGLFFQSGRWCVMRRKDTERGTWFRMRHVCGFEGWIGTAHFTPGSTQAVHAAEVSNHLAGVPATTLPILLCCDVNSPMVWRRDEDGDVVAVADNGKTLEFLSQSDLEDCNRWPLGRLSSQHLPVDQGRQVKSASRLMLFWRPECRRGRFAYMRGPLQPWRRIMNSLQWR